MGSCRGERARLRAVQRSLDVVEVTVFTLYRSASGAVPVG